MLKIPSEVIEFFNHQGFVIISTFDKDGGIHNACKGIIKIFPEGKVYLLDLYRQETYRNLLRYPAISITAVDEHRFRGYCLKGEAEIANLDNLTAQIKQAWESKITSRITQRLIRNLHGEKGHSLHPEARLPQPEYLIVMQVKEIINLTPKHLKKE